MATFTHADLEALWRQAGGPAAQADVAAAIAQAESGGCQYALAGPLDIRPVKQCTYRFTTSENSCGLWQVNLMAHPDYHAPSIFDPLTNARAAVAISNRGASFVPWSTYGNGAYEAYLSVKSPAPTVGPSAPPGEFPHTQSGWHDLTGAVATRLPSRIQEARNLNAQTRRALARNRRQ